MFELHIKHFDGEIELEGTYDTYMQALQAGRFILAQMRGVRNYEIKEIN